MRCLRLLHGLGLVWRLCSIEKDDKASDAGGFLHEACTSMRSGCRQVPERGLRIHSQMQAVPRPRPELKLGVHIHEPQMQAGP